jgi:hypothetical protein
MDEWLDLDIVWLPRRKLVPKVVSFSASVPFEEPGFDVDLASAYRWREECVKAREAGKPPPPATNAITPAQHLSMQTLEKHWDEIEKRVEAAVLEMCRTALDGLPPNPEVFISSGHITARQRGDYVYIELGGGVEVPYFDEHGFTAVLHGTEVVDVAEWGRHAHRQPTDTPEVEPIDNPDARPLGSAEILELALSGQWERLDARVQEDPEPPNVGLVLLRRIERGTLEDAMVLLEDEVYLKPFGRPLTEELLDVLHPDVLTALVTRRILVPPPEALFQARDADALRRWVALGARIDRSQTVTGADGNVKLKPLLFHVNHLDRFEALLELGADASCLKGKPLAAPQRAILARLRPELAERDTVVPEPEVSRAQGAASLLQEWLERGWLELTPDANIAALTEALDLLAEGPPSAVADALFELDGVEELYASDDEIEEFLSRW